MSFTFVQLGQIIEPAPLIRAGNSDYPVLSMTMHNGLVDQSEKFKKRVASSDTSSYKAVSRGQLVVGFPIDEGVLSFQRRYPKAVVSPAYDIWNLIDSSIVFDGYLERFLRSPRAISFYSSKLRGTTARRRTLPQEIFLNLPVPLPPLNEQRRIAAVLDKVDALRAKRREAIALLDDLTQSVFLDMFGDPILNDRDWPRVSFGSLLQKVDSGQSPKCLARPAEEGEWGVLKLGAITQCEYLPNENKALPEGVEPHADKEVQVGDLLFSRKNTRELVAACVLVRETPRRLLLPDLMFRLILKNEAKIEKTYLHQLLINPKKRRAIQSLAGGSSGSMPNISKSRLVEIDIELPPLELQNQFAERVTAIESLKRKHLAHLTHLDELFASLQQRAFRGELFSSEAA